MSFPRLPWDSFPRYHKTPTATIRLPRLPWDSFPRLQWELPTATKRQLTTATMRLSHGYHETLTRLPWDSHTATMRQLLTGTMRLPRLPWDSHSYHETRFKIKQYFLYLFFLVIYVEQEIVLTNFNSCAIKCCSKSLVSPIQINYLLLHKFVRKQII